ncbi:hypothetical protein D0962_20630 [Leptolyngbyaceae cyanobacterium CCMR0082]|uniref:Uncharacterized protein n=1 Tax=Adonisia turfae CCMR0082 TaxID=2304604 RepID=A0A6M0SB02_9CYAN|nr:hypothetical protein [Adonisia turfae CCMR0082]
MLDFNYLFLKLKTLVTKSLEPFNFRPLKLLMNIITLQSKRIRQSVLDRGLVYPIIESSLLNLKSVQRGIPLLETIGVHIEGIIPMY